MEERLKQMDEVSVPNLDETTADPFMILQTVVVQDLAMVVQQELMIIF